jgi:two-component system chemotaxis response regulator CheB
MTAKIKVLIVDDSALIRKLLSTILASDKAIEVVGAARDPYDARDKINELKPDVVTLDVEMPKMDGITFLKNMMRLHPLPVIMISSLTKKGADVTLQALEAGAVDFVSKPCIDIEQQLLEFTDEITSKVKMAAGVKLRSPSDIATAINRVVPKLSADAIIQKLANPGKFKTTDRIVAIGASTGGTEAIKEVLMAMPADAPGIVITQHIPAAFSKPFAERMNKLSAMTVCEAHDGQQILPGHAYIAPGSHHLLIKRDGARYVCHLNDGPPVNRHKPSVDVMFRSVAENVGPNAIGVILTGMGNDGAQGLKEIQQNGSTTIAQDENTSVVWGMPGEAVKLGVDQILPLENVANTIMSLLKSSENKRTRAI